MPNCENISGGKLPCPHWDAETWGGEYVKRAHPELAAKTTEIWYSWYVDNLDNIPLAELQPFLGQYLVAQPSRAEGMVPVAGVVEINTGIAVRGRSWRRPKSLSSWSAIGEGWGKTAGNTAVYAELSDEASAKLYGPVFGADMDKQLRFGEKHPDWYSCHPESTVAIKDLSIEGEIHGWEQGLEYYKTRLRAAVGSWASHVERCLLRGFLQISIRTMIY
ncbi:hypothetical protein LX36DRAFT_696630 [Colletotrichum falcatum]|nr:hypothetical protein LX36DRAFT_696630 [Colletotrichum falcatum]